MPAFLAIPFFKDRYGVDPLVYLVWYFMATAISIALYWASSGRASARGSPLVLPVPLAFASRSGSSKR